MTIPPAFEYRTPAASGGLNAQQGQARPHQLISEFAEQRPLLAESQPYGYEAVAIEGYGRNEQEALESFADVFAATWDGYAAENDRGLSGDARDLQRTLLALVAEVEPAE